MLSPGSRLLRLENKITALESDSQVQHMQPRQLRIKKSGRTYLYQVHDEDLVSLEELEALVERLVGDDRVLQDSQVVCIIGGTGIDKTTIEKKIYRHVEIKNQFHTG